MKFDQDLCATCDMNSTLGSVVPLAMFVSKRRVTYFRSANFVKTGQKQIKLYETFQITLMSQVIIIKLILKLSVPIVPL